MSDRAKHLYRVTATFPDGRVWRRDYQTRWSAEERHDQLLAYEERTGAIVTITVSDPITWPTS